jgi:hypothetical protein
MDTKKIISAAEQKNNLLRREMGLIEPDYGRWPKWFLMAIVRASKGFRIDQDVNTKSEASMHRDWGGRWLDHWGTIEKGGRELFVAEPYHLQPADADEAIAFADAIDECIQIDYGRGWHAPNLTDRIIIGGRL